MTMRDQLSNVTVSLLSHGYRHDTRGAVRGVAGAGMRQRQRCIDGFIYSAGAFRDVTEALNTVVE